MTPEIILGPPGTGKTTRLLELVDQELANGTPPDRVGYVSFTRRAADEASTRAAAKFNLTRNELPWFRTLHSLCYKYLGLQRGDVMDEKRLKEFANYAGIRFSGGFSEDGTLTGYELGDRALHMINLARVKCVPLRQLYDQDDDGIPWSELRRIDAALSLFKKTQGFIDFTDMLEMTAARNPKIGIDVLFIDESQDLSLLQWQVITVLAAYVRRVVIAGDDDQAIYRWAGAAVDYLIEMKGTVNVLNQSYRVPPAIQTLANTLINPVAHRRPKQWSPRVGEEGEVAFAENIERVNMDEGEILILVRNTFLLRELVEPHLRRQGIVYERHGYSSIKPDLLAAIMDWEALRAHKTISVEAARRVYGYMSAGKGMRRGFKTLAQIPDGAEVDLPTLQHQGGLLRDDIWHEALDRLPSSDMAYILAARRRGEKLLQTPRVRLSTIHGSKGGEADHVILLREMAARSHREMERDTEHEDDERRVWYVAATRARRKLTIVNSRTNLACGWL